MRGNRRPNAGQLWRIGLQRLGRNVRRTAVYRARLVWLFSKPFQSDAGWNAGWRTHRDRVVPLALVARVRPAPLVRMEVSEFYYLVDHTFVAAPDLLALPQTNGGRATVFRSHAIAALDNVGFVLRSDCSFTFRNARGAARFKQIRSALPWSRAGRHRAIIKALSPQGLFPVRAGFFPGSKGNVFQNKGVRIRRQCP